MTLRGPGEIFYSGTGASDFFKLLGVGRITFEDLIFRYTDSNFTGAFFQTGPGTGVHPNDAGQIRWNRCSFYTVNAEQDAKCKAWIALDYAIVCTIRDCQFSLAAIGIRGRVDAFANQIIVQGCSFHRLKNLSIHNPGEAWLIQGNTFAPVMGGLARNAITHTLDYWSKGLCIVGNWFGDGHNDDPNDVWITFASEGAFIAGNAISISSSISSPHYAVRVAGSSGVAIIGNQLGGNGVDFIKDIHNHYNSGAAIIGNCNAAVPPGGVGSTVGGLSVFSNNDVGTLPMIALPLAFGSDSAIPPVNEVAFRDLSWTPGAIANGTFIHTVITLTGAHSAESRAFGGLFSSFALRRVPVREYVRYRRVPFVFT